MAKEKVRISTLLFKKGEELRCPNGHLIGTYLNDVYYGDMVYTVKIDWELGNEHEVGDMIKPCAACGANWHEALHRSVAEKRNNQGDK